jgi:hypothetical protein
MACRRSPITSTSSRRTRRCPFPARRCISALVRNRPDAHRSFSSCDRGTKGQSSHWRHLIRSGSDGTLDLSEIQAHGGVTFAQDGASAKYDGMPPERGCRRLRGIRASSQRNRQGTRANCASSLCGSRDYPRSCGSRPTRKQGTKHSFPNPSKVCRSGLHALPANHHIATGSGPHGGSQD